MVLITPGRLSRMLIPLMPCLRIKVSKLMSHPSSWILTCPIKPMPMIWSLESNLGKDPQKFIKKLQISGEPKVLYQMVFIKDQLEIAGSSLLPLPLLRCQRESRELSGTIAMTKMVLSDLISGSRTNGMQSILMTVFHLTRKANPLLPKDQSTMLGGCHWWRRLMLSLTKTTKELSLVWAMKVLGLWLECQQFISLIIMVPMLQQMQNNGLCWRPFLRGNFQWPHHAAIYQTMMD